MSENSSWVFDALICFLHGPIWNTTIQSFINENSLFFTENPHKDSFCEEHKKAFEEYKDLVNMLLENFMKEMKISTEQFELACLEGKSQQAEEGINFYQGFFQQVWAANDVNTFIRMMTLHNVEQQLQALELLGRRQITSPDRDIKPNKIDKESLETLEDNTLEEIKLASTSLINDEENQLDSLRLNLYFEDKKVDISEMRSRREHLRKQRDKILKFRNQTKIKQFSDTFDNPRSSQTLESKNLLEVNKSCTKQNEHISKQTFDLRKTLAKRLRNEVVESE